ncbi:Daunorubicin resistance ABC transporter, ATP-bind ing protein [Devosia sp. DBB001]|nr:ATP-binding cassette domain-containing protein [Devosia sp. D6-9]CDP53112.1 Daunorubicin resistance ABC transporter, ATP-bind ing protein [Devosia sp. DBB001]
MNTGAETPATTSFAIIAAKNLAKRYGETQALDDVSFDVRRGELFALLGPNGAGKTTLLSILCTILKPDSGTATIAGMDVLKAPLRARRNIGVVFQEPSLDDRLSVEENLQFHALAYGVQLAVRQRRIDELLDLVELSEVKERLVRTLSSGMKRRLEIARALVHNSRVLFLDEPTVGLDAQSRERIWFYLRRLQELRGLTIVVTTHYIEEVERCDRVCVVDHGKILAMGTPDELKHTIGQEYLRVRPRDSGTKTEILAQYGNRAAPSAEDILISNVTDDDVEAFLDQFGRRIRSLDVERPSLESVFLALTGKAPRDQAASPRERTLSFAKRGGEHTR